MTETIAITGVTGDVGGKTLELLHAEGVQVRAVVRRRTRPSGSVHGASTRGSRTSTTSTP